MEEFRQEELFQKHQIQVIGRQVFVLTERMKILEHDLEEVKELLNTMIETEFVPAQRKSPYGFTH